MQISFLEGLGIPSQSVCNMASMVPKILGVQESAAKEVVDYLKGKGLSGVACNQLACMMKLPAFQSPIHLSSNLALAASLGSDDSVHMSTLWRPASWHVGIARP